jgi:hypothetical protein
VCEHHRTRSIQAQRPRGVLDQFRSGGAFVVAHSCGFGCEDEAALAASPGISASAGPISIFSWGSRRAAGWVRRVFNYPRWSSSIVGLWYPSAKGASYVKFGLGALVRPAGPRPGFDRCGQSFARSWIRVPRGPQHVRCPYIDGCKPSVSVDLGENYLPHTGHVGIKIVNIGLGVTWH